MKSYTEYNGSIFADGIMRKVTIHDFLSHGSLSHIWRHTEGFQSLRGDDFPPLFMPESDGSCDTPQLMLTPFPKISVIMIHHGETITKRSRIGHCLAELLQGAALSVDTTTCILTLATS